jgi:cell division protein FtsZ
MEKNLETTQLKRIMTTPKSKFQLPVIKVLGLGGAGCNTINNLMEMDLPGIDCIAANTDAQVLEQSKAPTRIQLGPILTKGLGSGGDPAVGEKAAEESSDDLDEALQGADLVFLTAGMGGGTGTGATPVAARLALSLGALVISIVTTPFTFESGKRQSNAREGIAQLRPNSDTLIIVPNDRLLQIAPVDLSMEMAFRLSDDVLRQSIQSISDLVTQTGLINIDFAHILRLMRLGGGTYFAIGHGEGKDKVQQAIQQALNHPLLETIHLEQAKGLIINFTGGASLTMNEVGQALNQLREKCHPDAEIIPGMTSNSLMQDRVELILLVTGVGATAVQSPLQAAASLPRESAPKETHTSTAKPKPSTFTSTKNDPQDEMEIPAYIRKHIQLNNGRSEWKQS